MESRSVVQFVLAGEDAEGLEDEVLTDPAGPMAIIERLGKHPKPRIRHWAVMQPKFRRPADFLDG